MRALLTFMNGAVRCGFASVLCLAVLAGCGSFPRTPPHPYDDPRFRAPKREPRPGLAENVPPSLLLLPGDLVEVETVSTATTTTASKIDATGHVHVPLAGDVRVEGMSLTDAERTIKRALQRYDKYVHVNLRMAEASGHTVTVIGALRQPGVLPLPPGARLSDVLLLAGGELIENFNGQMVSGSDMRGAKLVRDGKTIPIDFRLALQGDPRHNVYLYPGDHVHVPPQSGNNIIVLGAGGGTVFQFAEGMRLTEALARAGGISAAGDKNDIRVVRGPLEAPIVYQSSIQDVVDGEAHDVELYAGDIIWVEDHWIDDFGEVMQVLTPLISTTLATATLYVALERSNN